MIRIKEGIILGWSFLLVTFKLKIVRKLGRIVEMVQRSRLFFKKIRYEKYTK